MEVYTLTSVNVSSYKSFRLVRFMLLSQLKICHNDSKNTGLYHEHI